MVKMLFDFFFIVFKVFILFIIKYLFSMVWMNIIILWVYGDYEYGVIEKCNFCCKIIK